VDAHPAQEVVAEGIHPQNLVRSDERRPGPGLGHDLGDQGIAFHPLVREYDFPAELGNPVQQLVGSGRRSALEHTEKRRGRGSHRLAQIGDPARLFRLFVQPFYGLFVIGLHPGTVASFFIYGKIPMWHFSVAIYFHIWNYPFRTWDRARFREPARGCAPALGTPCPAQSGARPASSARRYRFAGVSSRGQGSEKLKEHLRFRGDGRAAPDAIREER